MSFFQELKCRNVFRVAIVYIVTGWLVLQVADVLFDALETCLSIDRDRIICRDYLAEALLFAGHTDRALTEHAEMLEIGEMQRRMLFHPDAAAFRQTPQFRQIVRDRGFLRAWQALGFPAQCRPSGADDFKCS